MMFEEPTENPDEMMLEDQTQETDTMTPPEDQTMMEDKEKTTPPSDQQIMDETINYLPFTPEVLADSSDTRRVLFFYANWCPTCLPADADFTKNINKLPSDLTLIRVNYEDTDTDQAEKDLAQKYAVTYQHTFIQIDSTGQVLTKWNGGQTEELLKNII